MSLRFAIPVIAAVSLAACGIALNGLGPPEGADAEDSGVRTERDADGGATDGTGPVQRSNEASASDDSPSRDTSVGDTSVSDTGAGDTGVRDTSVSDTSVVATLDAASDGPTADACTPTGQENCTNGTDDDCNGLADCADPACVTAGFACVDAPPTGWTAAAFSATSRPGCPAALPTQANVDVDPTDLTSNATCGCDCTLGAPPSCVQGNLSTKYGLDNACNAGPGGGVTPVNVPTNDGGCTVQAATVDPFILATQPPLTGGSCTATSTVSRPATGATKGQVCGGQSGFGAGCSGGQVCALVPSGYQACIVPAGDGGACPAAAYTTAHAVGTIDDTRGCGTCGCTPPTATCAPGTWSFYTSGDCTGPAMTLPTNGVCNPSGEPPTGGPTASNQFTSAISGIACAAPAAPAPTGSVQLTSATTVCCE